MARYIIICITEIYIQHHDIPDLHYSVIQQLQTVDILGMARCVIICKTEICVNNDMTKPTSVCRAKIVYAVYYFRFELLNVVREEADKLG